MDRRPRGNDDQNGVITMRAEALNHVDRIKQALALLRRFL
jgi:hypothetical protein